MFFTTRGLAMMDASDDIEEHDSWLSADDPIQAREYMKAKQGVTLHGAGLVHWFKKTMLQSLQTPALPMEQAKAQRGRLLQGEVTDFRGHPLMEIASLSGQAVDHAVLQLPSRPSKEPLMRHQRTNHHNRGDFADYTHAHPGYYDKYVYPNSIVDAPRIHAIRGGVDRNDAAIITSVGSKRTKSVGDVQAQAGLPCPPSPASEEATEEVAPEKDQPAKKESNGFHTRACDSDSNGFHTRACDSDSNGFHSRACEDQANTRPCVQQGIVNRGVRTIRER